MTASQCGELEGLRTYSCPAFDYQRAESLFDPIFRTSGFGHLPLPLLCPESWKVRKMKGQKPAQIHNGSREFPSGWLEYLPPKGSKQSITPQPTLLCEIAAFRNRTWCSSEGRKFLNLDALIALICLVEAYGN